MTEREIEIEIEELKKRMTIIENNFAALINSLNRDKMYNKAETNSINMKISPIVSNDRTN